MHPSPWGDTNLMPNASAPTKPALLQENFATFLPNYLRLAAAVMLATFYLRPKALLGAAAVALSMYRSVGALLQRQRREQHAAVVAAAGGGLNGARAAARPPADPNEQAVNALVAVSTWVLVAYTRCMPMLLLGAWGALVAVLAHCALRRAPSEYRHKGRQLLGYTWQQVLGRGALGGAVGGAAGAVVPALSSWVLKSGTLD